MGVKLNPPIVDNKSPAQVSLIGITIPFVMNKSVGWADFDSVVMILKTVQTNQQLAILECTRDSLYVKDGVYQAYFESNKNLPLLIGQYYKVQLAYKSAGVVGFYSGVTTFKFTSRPEVTIQQLDTSSSNIHFYNYTGHYYNSDRSEKVYSYEFNLFDGSNKLVASSGEKLHNSSSDTDTYSSTDQWTTRYGLQPGSMYTIVYKVKTLNGLEYSSPAYIITDNQGVPSDLFKYYDFIATNLEDHACVELSIQPKKKLEGAGRKFVNGKFVLLRASSEDNFNTWHELTRFIISSWDSKQEKVICNDYSVSQGVTYIYGLQAYNDQGIYSTREESSQVQVDFEDIFLSDGERQLRIRFNPKVTSIKNTILEAKMDTLGGKYPFFFRNGNVKYKEFPISGLISLLMDENEEFIKGIQYTKKTRENTPADPTDFQELSTMLTGNNFRREREFKTEVLEWLTNGKPKLFRSPGEGSFIVRLMNTSLSPNDTLSRMLHTFSCTAYEIADFNFENLREYGMMMDEYIETRELRSFNRQLEKAPNGTLFNLNACMATVTAVPFTTFNYRLQGDESTKQITVGATGVYVFSPSVLQETPLLEIGHSKGQDGWMPGAILSYSTYVNPAFDSFSYIHSISIDNKIEQWIGSNRPEIDYHLDTKKILKSIGMIHCLNIQKRHVRIVDTVEVKNGKNIFKNGDIIASYGRNDLIYCTSTKQYYDGRTALVIGPESAIDYRFQLRSDEDMIDLKGVNIEDGTGLEQLKGCESITTIGGRIVLTHISDVDYLYIGNGLYVDIAYQEINKLYTVEVIEGGQVYIAKQKWLETNKTSDYNKYYNLLYQAIQYEQGG